MQKYDELLVSLRKVIRAIDLHSKQLNKTSGLTGPQLLIMQEVAHTDGITASRIAQNVNLSPATVTNILDRIESRNLVTRVRSQMDKRRVSLYLTEQGKDFRGQIHAALLGKIAGQQAQQLVQVRGESAVR